VIRTDVRVPVLPFQIETDLIGLEVCPTGARQPQLPAVGARHVHAEGYTLDVGFTDTGNDPAGVAILITASPIPGIIDCGSPVNSGPQH
jgi:hypothetical protein